MAVRPEPLPRNPGGKVLEKGLRTQTQWSAVRTWARPSAASWNPSAPSASPVHNHLGGWW